MSLSLYDILQITVAGFVAYLLIRDTLPSGAPKAPTADTTKRAADGAPILSRVLDWATTLIPGSGITLAELEQELEPAPAVAPVIPFCTLEGRGSSIHWLSLQDGHWGIFGSTGSGKGNALQQLALSLLQYGPGVVEVVVLDPKAGLDYSWAEGLEHSSLFADGAVSNGYQFVLAEMSRRNRLLRGSGCRNIREYNLKAAPNRLPYMVVIADEVADLAKEDKGRLASLARMGRAAGLVLFVSTQYPTAEAIPTQIQANLANRLCLKLNSKRYTEVALGRGYGEKGELEPACFEGPGIAVLKTERGQEQLARVPELTEARRDELLAELMEAYPRITEYQDEPPQDALQGPQEPISGLAAPDLYSTTPQAPVCSKCGAGPELGEMRLTPRGGKHIHIKCWGAS